MKATNSRLKFIIKINNHLNFYVAKKSVHKTDFFIFLYDPSSFIATRTPQLFERLFFKNPQLFYNAMKNSPNVLTPNPFIQFTS